MALIHEGRASTYRELRGRVERLASGLRALGLERGDRVAYLGVNHPAFLETLFAAGVLGAVFVPVHARQPTEVARHIVRDAGATILVHGPERAERASALASEVRTVLAVGAELEAAIERAPDARIDEPVGLDDLAILAYTSGTTGLPKGAMLSHGNLTWNVVNMLASLGLGASDVSIAAAPLYRIGGLGVTLLETLYVGGTVVLASSSDAGEVLDLVETHGATTLFVPPDIMRALAESDRWAAADLSTLRLCVTGGTLVPEPRRRTCSRRSGPPARPCSSPRCGWSVRMARRPRPGRPGRS
jgi:fatty-acyl-CoA synthase